MISAIYVSSRASEPKKAEEIKNDAESAQNNNMTQKKVSLCKLQEQIISGEIQPTFQNDKEESCFYQNIAEDDQFYYDASWCLRYTLGRSEIFFWKRKKEQ